MPNHRKPIFVPAKDKTTSRLDRLAKRTQNILRDPIAEAQREVQESRAPQPTRTGRTQTPLTQRLDPLAGLKKLGGDIFQNAASPIAEETLNIIEPPAASVKATASVLKGAIESEEAQMSADTLLSPGVSRETRLEEGQALRDIRSPQRVAEREQTANELAPFIAPGLLDVIPGVGYSGKVVSGAETALRRGVPAIRRATTKTATQALETAARNLPGEVETAFAASRYRAIPALKEIDDEIRGVQRAIETANRVGADTASLDDTFEAMVITRRNILENELGPERFQRLLEVEQELDEAVDVLNAAQAPGPRAPSFGTAERAAFDNERRLASEAGQKVTSKAQRVREARQRVRELRDEYDRLSAGDPQEVVTSPPSRPATAVQSGLGIGEAPSQGELLPEFRGTGETPRQRIAADAAEQAAREAEIRRTAPLEGQQSFVEGEPAIARAAGDVPPPIRGVSDDLPPSIPEDIIPPEPVPPGRIVAPLREFDDVVDEVVTSENPVTRAIIGHLGINPSILRDSDVGKATVAYFRQLAASEQITDTALAVLDAKSQRFTGRMGGVLPINRDGFFGKTGRQWNDVFSRPGDYELSPRTRDYIDDYLQIVNEVEELRVQNGLKPRAKKGEEGWFYVPRQVEGVRGVELRRPSSANLQRVWEEATEGAAAGIRYERDPRAVLELHVRAAFKEIAEKQLSDAVEPFAVKPKDLIPDKVRIRMERAIEARKYAERELRRAKREAQGEELVTRTGLRQAQAEVEGGLGPATSRIQQELRSGRADLRRQLEKRVTDAEANLKKVQVQYQAARKAYSKALEAARKSEIAPGSLFDKSEELISVGQWRSKFFPLEDQKLLVDALGAFGRPKSNLFWRGLTKLANMRRFLASVGDFAMPFLQGQTVLARNPLLWAKMTAKHYEAFFDPTAQARFIRDHLETFQEMARYNIPVGDPEFFAALRSGEGLSPGRLLEFLPKGKEARGIFQATGRQTFGRFQSSYNTGLTVARALLWEARKGSWKGDLDSLAAHIRNMTGGLDSRSLAIGPGQRAAEGMWLAFSPRFLRSTIALIADAPRLNTPQGREAARTLAQWASGVTAIYVLTGMALGKSESEIKAGLNPLNGKKFLSHEINGDWIGLGGQIRAMSQLIASIASGVTPGGKPIGDLASLDRFENPLIQFYAYRGAPGITLGTAVLEPITGSNVAPFEKIEDIPDLTKFLFTSSLPFAVQGALEGEKPFTTGAAIAGARTSPQTRTEREAEFANPRGGRPTFRSPSFRSPSFRKPSFKPVPSK